MKTPKFLYSVLFVMVLTSSVCTARTKNPPRPSPAPKPTPTPRTLGEAAPKLRLDRIGGDTKTTVITNAELEKLARDGRLITATVAAGEAADAAGSAEPADPGTRARWRKRYLKQRRRIQELNDDLHGLRLKLREVRKAFPSVRNRVEKEKLRTEIKRVLKRVDRERKVLNSIIREARKEGAQPGWFR